MRATASFVVALTLVGLGASCSTPDQDVTAARRAIAYGDPDTTHSAVVAVLAMANDGLAACSGTIVQVVGDYGYVLTAAHCCNQATPSIIAMGEDYEQAIQYVGGIAKPPAYAVSNGTVYYDSLYSGTGSPHDFCMLKFAGATGAPTIALPSGSDGVTTTTDLEHVGFGTTNATMDNTQRRTGTDEVNTLDTNEITWTQGGSSLIPGTCQGDSGGPALVPAGAAQNAQKVVAVTSYGDDLPCASVMNGAGSRVSSALGASGFITKFLADTPIGTKAPNFENPSCGSCTATASGTSCASQADACVNNTKCSTLLSCLNACTTTSCVSSCESAAGTATVDLLNAFYQCVCESPACESLCSCPVTEPPPDLRKPRDLTDPNAVVEDMAEPSTEEVDLADGTTKPRRKSGGCQVGGEPGDAGLIALALAIVAQLALVSRRRRA